MALDINIFKVLKHRFNTYMALKSFKEFLKEEYLAVESIRYLDDKIFKPFLAGKYNMTDAELKNWRNKQNLIKEDDDKYWMENDEELKLIETYQKDPDSPEGRDAMNKLVENKIPYVKSKVGKYIAAHPESISYKDDMEQECLIALTKAIEKFDTSSGNIFNAYVNKYISGTLTNFNNPNRQSSIVNGKGDSYGNHRVSTVSIDTPVAGDNGEWADKEQTLGDKIEDNNARLPTDFTDEEMAEHETILHDWYDTLPQAEQIAIKMYLPSAPGAKKATFDEIGAALGMSKMGAQKLVNRVLIKIHKLAEQAGFTEAPDLEKDPEYYQRFIDYVKGKGRN